MLDAAGGLRDTSPCWSTVRDFRDDSCMECIPQ